MDVERPEAKRARPGSRMVQVVIRVVLPGEVGVRILRWGVVGERDRGGVGGEGLQRKLSKSIRLGV